MKIIADENIPCVAEAFGSLGQVSLLPGRGMSAAQVRDADVLLVRSVTRVDEALLAGSSIRFVGSATIGFDHVDRDYLGRQGIGFATAPGSNAVSAAEYVVSAIMVLSEQQGFAPGGKTVGIIGHGNVGSRVRQRLEALGMRCLVNDPPLQAQGVQGDFVDLDTILQTDIITVHVPYTHAGQWPTHHLVDADFLARARPDAVLINTSRGAVCDNRALGHWLDGHAGATAVLDVWEGEPSISVDLMHKVAIATPHIAGYSLDGKLRGTDMIYRAACEFLGERVVWSALDAVPEAPEIRLETADCGSRLAAVRRAVLACYDVRNDDRQLRRMSALPPADRAAYFDRLRREYPVRREFPSVHIACSTDDAVLQRMLGELGFNLGSVPAAA